MVLMVRAESPILIARIVLAGVVLSRLPPGPNSLEYGFSASAPWGAGSDVREMKPERPIYFLHEVLEPDDPPLEPGRYSLSASAYIFTTAKKQAEYGLKDFRLMEAHASRELEVP